MRPSPGPRARRSAPRWLALGLALGLATPLAGAQAGPDYAAAKQHYQAAESAMAAGDFATAAREYGTAYEITRDAVLFYKLAAAFQRKGDCASALVYYRRYLAEGNPDASFRARTEAEIRACEAAGAGATPPAPAPADDVADVPRPATAATAGAGEPAVAPGLLDQPTTWQKTAAWTSVGVTAALLTAGAVLGLSARSREEDVANLADFRNAEGEPATYTGATRERYEDLVEEGEDLERLAIIAFSAAGGTAALAVVFFLLDDPPDPDDTAALSFAPASGGDGLAVRAGWSF
jgi:hypothetical protein